MSDPATTCIPSATYRLQLHSRFTFADAAAIAPYLARLGVSHVYLSPIQTARRGSSHGYDVIDHATINPELGGDAGFRTMAREFRARGLGILLDIVPNHMAACFENAWWRDVLEKGAGSRFANHFDIDWQARSPRPHGKVLLPILGRPLHEVLAEGEIDLSLDKECGKYVFRYFRYRVPLRLEDQASVEKTLGADVSRDPVFLESLLVKQNFELAWWITARDRINWRRFFDVNDLVGLNTERPEVFDAVHALALGVFEEGLIDGLRVDHVDGLADPARYCRKLRAKLSEREPLRPVQASKGPAYLIVEKILARGEELPAAWDVDGTTGYDFMNDVSALQHEPSGEAALTTLWQQISGCDGDFETVERSARREILLQSFASPLETLASHLATLARGAANAHELTEPLFERTLVRLLCEMRSYRVYPNGGAKPPLRDPLGEAATRAGSRALPDEKAALSFLVSVVTAGISDDEQQAARLFHQLSSPLAAKAVEDTAFYRYGRLLSRNDVGFDPREFALSPAEFHRRCSVRQISFPAAMVTTATHDHKHGEDARARLAVTSELPDAWREGVVHWLDLIAAEPGMSIDRADLYQLLQTIVGAWPPDLALSDREGLASFARRIAVWQRKALREAKQETSWFAVNEVYEAAATSLAERILDPARSKTLLASLKQFVDRVASAGAANSLVQAALRLTGPGVPDTYQGCERWDFSLVDPDNRRPVDFARAKTDLADRRHSELLAQNWRDGRIKQRLAARLMGLRRERPLLLRCGSVVPLNVDGPRAAHVIAFARRHGNDTLVVIAGLHLAAACMDPSRVTPDPVWWDTTFVDCTNCAAKLENVLGNAAPLELNSRQSVGGALQILPVAVFASAQNGT